MLKMVNTLVCLWCVHLFWMKMLTAAQFMFLKLCVNVSSCEFISLCACGLDTQPVKISYLYPYIRSICSYQAVLTFFFSLQVKNKPHDGATFWAFILDLGVVTTSFFFYRSDEDLKLATVLSVKVNCLDWNLPAGINLLFDFFAPREFILTVHFIDFCWGQTRFSHSKFRLWELL
jgi:hypothetical protein